ncbi:MAG TPA: hypothetical protein VIJ22_18815, partial [Polyangiaceae bacterium]
MGPTRVPVAAKTQPKRAPITVAHTIQPHRAGPWIWCSAPNRSDDADTPTSGRTTPRKSNSSPAALATAITRRPTSPAPCTAGRSAAWSAR